MADPSRTLAQTRRLVKWKVSYCFRHVGFRAPGRDGIARRARRRSAGTRRRLVRLERARKLHDDRRGRRRSASADSNTPTHNNDRDNDRDHNHDDARALNYGHAADAAGRRVLATLVARYFAAAAAGDGGSACRLLVPLQAESVVEEDGRSPSLRGRTCAVVMSKLFKLHHRELAEKSAALRVIETRVKDDRGLAILYFSEIPEVREIGLRRVGGKWKVLDLLDGILE